MASTTDDDGRSIDGNNVSSAGDSSSFVEKTDSLGSHSRSSVSKTVSSGGNTCESLENSRLLPENCSPSPENDHPSPEKSCPSPANGGSPKVQKVVDSPVTEPIVIQLQKKLEAGSILENLDQVYVLYCEYARCIGFSVKKGTQSYFKDKKGAGKNCEDESSIRMKVYHCSCEGFPDKKRSINQIPKYKKQVLRSDCKARLRVVRKRDGPWVVSVFYKDHNHELLNPEQSYLLRSARNLSYAKKSIVEALHAAGIGISRVCGFMEKESGGPQNVGFTRPDVYAHFNKLKKITRIDNGDANALLKYFIEKSNNEESFYWKVEMDDDGRLMNLFIRDGQAAVDYEFFGDVMTVDTTFRTNRYNLICAPFVGINHHGNNVMFAIAFLSDETTETFEWLFEAFLESMDKREPQVIFTDQCQAMINGIDFCFRTARHRLCQWHINQNAPRHFGKLNKNKEFKNLWYRCMNHCDTEDEFEKTWAELIATYNLKEVKWFSNMYKLRRRWADVFTNQLFSAGMHATSRSEVTNKVIKDLCSSSCSLIEFVTQYERLQSDWRRIENEEDAKCRGMPGQLVENNPLLSHAGRVLTRYVYKLFEKQALKSINVIISNYPTDFNCDEVVFKVASTTNPDRIRMVRFNRSTRQISCSCHLWDVKGVMCYHMFRILYLLDVREIPDGLILKRWTRDAKLRHKVYVEPGFDCSQPNTVVHGMTFVNNLMRHTYELGIKYMGDEESINIIDDWMNELEKELVRNTNRRNRKRKPKEAGTQEEFQDPPIPSRGSLPCKRKQTYKPNTKRAVSKRGARRKKGKIMDDQVENTQTGTSMGAADPNVVTKDYSESTLPT